MALAYLGSGRLGGAVVVGGVGSATGTGAAASAANCARAAASSAILISQRLEEDATDGVQSQHEPQLAAQVQAEEDEQRRREKMAEEAAARAQLAAEAAAPVPVAEPTPPTTTAPPSLPEPKYARAIYDFTPESTDEVELHEGDPVLVVDDVSSEEWWCIRVVEADGSEKEGVVPAAYLSLLNAQESQDLLGGAEAEEEAAREQAKVNLVASSARSGDTVDPDNVPLAQAIPQGAKAQAAPSTPTAHASPAPPKVQPSVASPVSASSASVASASSGSTSSTKPKPNPVNTRLWQDKSGTYQVDAEFLRYEEEQGKVHLHKVNGVKIAVPLIKLSATDVAHVEKLTGMDLGSGTVKEEGAQKPKATPPLSTSTSSSSIAASTSKALVPSGKERPAQPAPIPQARERVYNPRFDWFDFFNLECGIDADDALRYAKTFRAERMDDGVLPHASRDMLRGMGLSNRDIERAMVIVDEYRRGLRQVSDIGAADAEYAQRLQDEEDARLSGTSRKTGETPARRNETDEEMARRLQSEEERGSGSRGGSAYRSASIRQAPARSAPTKVDAATLVRAGEAISESKSRSPRSAFDDDAWGGEPASKALVKASTPASSTRRVPSEVEEDLSQLEAWANSPTPSTRRGARPKASAPPPPTAYGGLGMMTGGDPNENQTKTVDLENSLPPPLIPSPQAGWGSGVFVPTRSSGRPIAPPPPPPTSAYPALRGLTDGSSSAHTPPSIAPPPPPMASSSMSLVRRTAPAPPSGFAGPAPRDQGLEALRLQQQLARIKQEQMMRQRMEQERQQREAAQAQERQRAMMAQQESAQLQQAQMLQAQRMASMGPSPFGSGSVQVGGYPMSGSELPGRGHMPGSMGGPMGGGGMGVQMGEYGYGRPTGMAPPPRPTVAPSASVMGPTGGMGGGGPGVNPLRPFDHIFNKPIQPPPVPMRGPAMMTGSYPSGPYGGVPGGGMGPGQQGVYTGWRG